MTLTRLLAGLALVAPAVLLVAAPSAAADASVELVATFANGQPAFVKDGEVNPVLTFESGENVTITLRYEGTHNVHVLEPVGAKTPIRDSGTENLSFTLPADFQGDVTYRCDVHEGTMQGTIRVHAPAGDADGDGADGNDGETRDDAPTGGTGDDAANGTESGDAPELPAVATRIDLLATQTSDDFFFEAPDGTRNPTLRLAPGEDVLIRLTVNGSHNIHVGAPVDKGTPVQKDGEATLRFTVPDGFEGTIEYWCDPHKFMGMAGTIRVGAQASGAADGDAGEGTGDDDAGDAGGGGASKRTPAPGVLAGVLSLAGAAALAVRDRRRD